MAGLEFGVETSKMGAQMFMTKSGMAGLVFRPIKLFKKWNQTLRSDCRLMISALAIEFPLVGRTAIYTIQFSLRRRTSRYDKCLNCGGGYVEK